MNGGGLLSPPIGPDAALEEARRAITRVRAEGRPGFDTAVTAGQPGQPSYVERLDDPGRGYFLVPWLEQRGIVLIVQVDAESGQMASVALQSQPGQQLVLSPAEAQCRATESLGVRVMAEPRLVWQPCRETASPFLPLYQIPVAGGSVFVAMDGSVYRQLTPFLKGGA